ncbi:MAG: hypothetical protein MN733_05500 [Nitrososphaera sp.]|nr:hypothetical protein [Nitrososphaera sp.]
MRNVDRGNSSDFARYPDVGDHIEFNDGVWGLIIAIDDDAGVVLIELSGGNLSEVVRIVCRIDMLDCLEKKVIH